MRYYLVGGVGLDLDTPKTHAHAPLNNGAAGRRDFCSQRCLTQVFAKNLQRSNQLLLPNPSETWLPYEYAAGPAPACAVILQRSTRAGLPDAARLRPNLPA